MKIRPGDGGHVGEQVELLGGQVDRLVVDAHLATRHIDRDAVEAELLAPLRLVGLAPVTAQDGLDARQQLGPAERLGDVVVGADLEPDDAVDLVALRRQDDHRGRHPLASQDAEDLDAAHARQHDVQQDEVEALAAGGLERRLAVGGGRHLVALSRQVEGQRLAQGRVVLDEEEAASHRSGGP